MVVKKYISKLIRLYPKIASGRKNFDYHEKRIQKNIKLSENFKKKQKM